MNAQIAVGDDRVTTTDVASTLPIRKLGFRFFRVSDSIIVGYSFRGCYRLLCIVYRVHVSETCCSWTHG